MEPLIVPNSFPLSRKENRNCINLNNNHLTSKSNIANAPIKKNNIYNNYISHKNSQREVNSLFIYNSSTSNCNTTCNTHTNSNNKSNSFHKNILKKKSENAFCCRINIIKNKKLDEKLNQKKIEEENNNNENNLYLIRESKFILNSFNNNNEVKSENYIKNVGEYIDDILEYLLKEEKGKNLKLILHISIYNQI